MSGRAGDIYDTGEFVIHYRVERQEGRLVVTEITGFSIQGQPVSRAALEDDFVVPDEYDLQCILDDEEQDRTSEYCPD